MQQPGIVGGGLLPGPGLPQAGGSIAHSSSGQSSLRPMTAEEKAAFCSHPLHNALEAECQEYILSKRHGGGL
jgi:hypothetical protein